MADHNEKAAEDIFPAKEEQEQEGQPLGDLRAGYVVGITKEGNFIFEPVGHANGLLELMGLHRYAETRLKSLIDARQNTGDKLTLEIGKVLGALLQEISKLTAALKKPDNKIV